jgi:DNA (cytosine-5)-methyltransferase 1
MLKLLDLFCGAGGAAAGYYKAGFEITGVDINPQPHYPFKFIQADAMTFNLNGYDVIHASPPCQSYSVITHMKRVKSRPKLIEPLRELLLKNGKHFVIENVEGAPLRNPLLLCGSSFGLKMIRHRLFEIYPKTPFCLFPPCNHKGMYDPWHYGINQLENISKALGIDWFMTRPEVREAIPPAYTEWIGKQLMVYFKT